ncbi:hypothetical protein C8255_22450 [filamentous cyanobacterium CCP3]|nr:hypothetical protein C8255_22450 [filamentous cyanobacterium CCP3]
MVASVATGQPDRQERPLNPNQTLNDALQEMRGDPPSSIPLVVRLLENPASPIALPGKIDLYRHDCLHVLLSQGFSLDNEAFVLGFTMGNDTSTRGYHLTVFKLCSRLLYAPPYRFERSHFEAFDRGFLWGQDLAAKNLNTFDFEACKHQTVGELRQHLGLDMAG